MTKSMLAPQNIRTYHPDAIFGANGLAQEAIAKYGKENVISATIGAILDENEKHVFFRTVEEVFRSLPNEEYSQYAPIVGLPDYLVAVEKECFGASRPKGFIRTVGVAGGTGGIHHLIHLYTEPGDEVLTADWYWGAYAGLCSDNHRSLATYDLLDENMAFNHASFQAEVRRLAEKQEHILLIMNTPAHNPTGYTISDADWQEILSFLKTITADGHHKVVLGIDVAYLDYAGDKDATRTMFKNFEGLPDEILTVVIYSLSKGYTLYGQRVGAVIGISANEAVADEFYNAAEFTSRGTWSNLCRPAMKTLAIISNDPEKQKTYEAERMYYNALIMERAAIFMEEAAACDLNVLPYHGGFFISVPCKDPKAVCDELHKDNVFLVPLRKGVRIAACAVPKAKMKGLAAKVKAAMERAGE